jgi:hypothetical protein
MICWALLLCLATALENNPFVAGPRPRIMGGWDVAFFLVLVLVIILLMWGYVETYGRRGILSVTLLATFAFGLWSLDPANSGAYAHWSGGLTLITLLVYWFAHPTNTVCFKPPKPVKVVPQA